ncbi:Pre-rRNA-processing protein TSR2-like [Lamellibrachia satsuma]|nr:Pre-rRNA-processing protein TSR2-like [Lamellibrachia satsuma]
MAASTESTFHKAVNSVFNSWTALQLAVQNGFGGQSSTAKALWMVDVTEQWLSENGDIEPYELEDYLAEILSNEFDTIVDDGSLGQVSKSICSYFRMCADKREAEVLVKINQLAPASVGQCVQQRRVTDDNSESDSSDSESEQDMEVGECVGATGGATCSTLMATTTRGSTAGTPTDHSQLLAASGDTASSHDGQKEDAEMREERKMDGTVEDDGWTVVKRHTKPRR